MLVGYAGLIAYDDEAHVATLGVAKALQGEGVGSLLLDDLLSEADKRSPVVLLEVRADNEVAQRLYARRGFEEIGRRRGYYQPSGDDAVVMKRRACARSDGRRGPGVPEQEPLVLGFETSCDETGVGLVRGRTCSPTRSRPRWPSTSASVASFPRSPRGRTWRRWSRRSTGPWPMRGRPSTTSTPSR